MSEETINIEVAFALPEKQTLLEITVAKGSNVESAISESGILNIYPEIDLSKNAVGVWNRTCRLSEVLRDGDRVEIYRPLIADPKDARRRRAEKAKEEGRADKVTGGRVKSNKLS